MDITVTPLNESYVKIKADFGIIQEMADYFSFFVDGYRFNNKYKYGTWDGKIRLMGINGELPYGLIYQLDKFASNMMYSLKFEDGVIPEPVLTKDEFDKWLDSKEIYSGQDVITPHWYQRDAVFEGINQQRSILNLPTSAGKSLIQALLAKWYLEQPKHKDKKILLLVPTTALVDQMINDFVDYRLFEYDDCLGIRAGTAKDSMAQVYVSTWQTAVKQPKSWFAQFGMLMNDECHLATGTSISKIIKNMTDCVFKIGLSGSLRDGKANLLQYIGLFGKVFKPVSTAQLMEEGQVTELKINAVMLEYDDADRAAMKGIDYQNEIKWLLAHKKRNKFIINLARKLSGKGENTLIMFKNIKHGKLLFEALKAVYPKVHYVAGDTKTDDRNELKEIAEGEDGMIIVASYGVFSTGISIKKLHNVIFAHPTKSKILNLQSIGRVLRKHKDKSVATLFDIVDNLAIKPKRKNAKKQYSHVNYCLKHGMTRLELYAREEFNYSISKVPMRN